jgi:hypothetical protein
MSQSQNQTIPREQFLTMATNLLHRSLIETPRTNAKNLYRAMTKGDSVHITTVEMQDKSKVRFDVAFDHTEFKGSVNFSAFRTSLSLLVSNLVKTLTEKAEITVFSAENDPNVMIFGVTAVTQEQGETNIMVLGADSSEGQPSVLLRLMYIDYSQFSDQASAGKTDQESQA